MADDVVHEFYHFILPIELLDIIVKARNKVHPNSHVKDGVMRIFSSGKVHLPQARVEAIVSILKRYAANPIEWTITGVSVQQGSSIFLDFDFLNPLHSVRAKDLRACIKECYIMWKLHPILFLTYSTTRLQRNSACS